MLMRKTDCPGGDTLFLLNHILGHRIDLPRIDGCRRGLSTFSLVDSGMPDLIVHVDRQHEREGRISIRATRFEHHDTWELHEVRCDEGARISSVALIGTKVVCVDDTPRRSIAFDLSQGGTDWFSPPSSPSCSKDAAMVFNSEFQGDVVKIYCTYPLLSTFQFMKVDWRRMEWVEMEEAKLENASWFLGWRWSLGVTNTVAEIGKKKKIYTLFPNMYEGLTPPVFRSGMVMMRYPVYKKGGSIKVNAYVHDMATRITEPILSTKFLTKNVRWIDGDFLGSTADD